MTEIKPGTPLPWGAAGDRLCSAAGGMTRGVATGMHNQDAAYAAQACNAYPSLLNGLREARDALVDASLFVELVRAHWENRGDQEQVEEAVDCLRQSNAVIANLDTLLSEGGQ